MSTLDDTAAGHSAPKRRFFLGFLLATACVLPAVAWADPLPDVASFTVRIIEASQEAVPHQDPGLEPIHTELKNFQHSYNQFKIVRSEVLKLKVNDRGLAGSTGSVTVSRCPARRAPASWRTAAAPSTCCRAAPRPRSSGPRWRNADLSACEIVEVGLFTGRARSFHPLSGRVGSVVAGFACRDGSC
jgi:hypothetical protein